MTAEMQMLAQLACEDGMPVPMARAIEPFGSVERAQLAVRSFHGDGVIEVLEAKGDALPGWRVAELCRLSADAWAAGAVVLQVRITGHGMKTNPGIG